MKLVPLVWLLRSEESRELVGSHWESPNWFIVVGRWSSADRPNAPGAFTLAWSCWRGEHLQWKIRYAGHRGYHLMTNKQCNAMQEGNNNNNNNVQSRVTNRSVASNKSIRSLTAFFTDSDSHIATRDTSLDLKSLSSIIIWQQIFTLHRQSALISHF